jgi:3-(3-hydroxy-phenyl)propionate hydroxylase
MHREPHGIWRVDYQLPAGETPDEALQPDSLKRRIDAQLAMIDHAGVPRGRWTGARCTRPAH